MLVIPEAFPAGLKELMHYGRMHCAIAYTLKISPCSGHKHIVLNIAYGNMHCMMWEMPEYRVPVHWMWWTSNAVLEIIMFTFSGNILSTFPHTQKYSLAVAGFRSALPFAHVSNGIWLWFYVCIHESETRVVRFWSVRWSPTLANGRTLHVCNVDRMIIIIRANLCVGFTWNFHYLTASQTMLRCKPYADTMHGYPHFTCIFHMVMWDVMMVWGLWKNVNNAFVV